jgi:CHAT domain-containing protein/tetratricopeptide (TPR) repeat protein
MASRAICIRSRGFLGAAAVVLSFLFLCAAALHAEAPKPEETLPLGETRERAIAAGEVQGWRVTVPAGAAVVITAEMQSIDLGMEARKIGGGELLAVHGGHDRWGPEVLLLEGEGEYHVEVRPMDKLVWPGQYALHAEVLPGKPAKSERREALALMSRAGSEAVPGTGKALQRAVATYRQALAAWHSVQDLSWEAETRVFLATLEKQLEILPSASEDVLEALKLWRQLGRPLREAEASNLLGVIYLWTKPEQAREPLEQAQRLWRTAEIPFEEEEAAGNLCNLEMTVGSLRKSFACYEKNLAFFRGRGVEKKEASIQQNLGGIHDLLGEPDEALDCYGKALTLWRSFGDTAAEADTLSNMAVVHRTLGEWQEALSLYDQARTLLAPLGDEAREGTLLNNIGFLYNATGNPQRALACFERSLEVNVKLRNEPAQIVSLNNLGTAWRASGNSAKALELHGRALALARSKEIALLEASSHQYLAEVYLERGEAAGALREIEEALPVLLKKAGLHTQAYALNLEGRALTLAGRAGEGLPVLRDALSRRQELRDRAGEAESLYSLALAERSLGKTADALSHAAEAVNGIEKLRTGFLSLNLRASYLATRRLTFSLLIDLLMDQNAAYPGKGYDQQAFAVSERARARSLLDVLRAGVGNGRTAPAMLAEKRTTLLRSLSAKIEQQTGQRGERAVALRNEIDANLADLERVEGEIRHQDPRFEAFSAPKPVGLGEISNWLEPGTMLLEYSLGESRSFLWAIENGRLRSFTLPGQKEIESLARQAYKEMSTPAPGEARRGEAAEKLSRILLGPVWSASEVKRLRRLVVVPDGALGILPFAALPIPEPGKGWQSPKDFLVEHLEVVYIPSATTLGAQRQGLERRQRASKQVAILADPVFGANDPRLTRLPSARSQVSRGPARRKRSAAVGLRGDGAGVPDEGLERLPSTRAEAEAIRDLAPDGQVWLGLGLDANRDAVLSGRLHDYRVIHFATHATADSRNPELSGLFLSQVDAEGRPQEGFLGLSDIYQLDLEADLVVLSGCRTALGKEVRGEGVMGLTRGFLYAGVPQVVASLWRVQDRATAELMTRFYRAMWHDGLPPVAALHEAQKWIRQRYRDPYFWAGFVLQGDWSASENQVRQPAVRRQ